MILSDTSLTEWTWFDLRLAKAYELRQDYGDIPPWIDRSDRVSFDVKTFVSKSEAVIERKQAADQKAAEKSSPSYGKRYYAVPKVNDGGKMPTMEEYYEDIKRKQSDGANKRRR